MPDRCRRARLPTRPDRRAVTGATLGLMQDSATEQAILLVPAWLFHL